VYISRKKFLLLTKNRIWHPPSILVTGRRRCLPPPVFLLLLRYLILLILIEIYVGEDDCQTAQETAEFLTGWLPYKRLAYSCTQKRIWIKGFIFKILVYKMLSTK